MRQVVRAMEEQLNEDRQELEIREQRQRAEDANRICNITHENAVNKGLSLVEKGVHQDRMDGCRQGTAREG